MTNSILCRHVVGPECLSESFEGEPASAAIDRYWDGRKAPAELITAVRCAWSEENLYFQFEAPFIDLSVNEDWARDESIYGLWQKDVVEVFLRPEISEFYFELEVSPLGQWLDALVRQPRKDIDFGWRSQMKVECEIDQQRKLWTARLQVPIEPMTCALQVRYRPEAGDAWKINLFRVSGAEPQREYLAWQPTFTPQPDFHVSSAFGNLLLVE